VLRVVQELLYTPVGLRTLSPRDPDFKPTYDGDLRARDAAYHQGTVWPWLLGHYVDAWLKLRPDRVLARDMVRGLEASLRDACLGQIGEIFDATPPFHHGAASRRRGAWPRRCGSGSRRAERTRPAYGDPDARTLGGIPRMPPSRRPCSARSVRVPHRRAGQHIDHVQLAQGGMNP
jgi:hypothetical protein